MTVQYIKTTLSGGTVLVHADGSTTWISEIDTLKDTEIGLALCGACGKKFDAALPTTVCDACATLVHSRCIIARRPTMKNYSFFTCAHCAEID